MTATAPTPFGEHSLSTIPLTTRKKRCLENTTHQVPVHRRPARRPIRAAIPVLLRIAQALSHRHRSSEPEHGHAIEDVRRQVVDRRPLDIVSDLDEFSWVGAVDGAELTVDDVLGGLNRCGVVVDVV